MNIAQTVPAAGQTTAVTWTVPTATDNVTPVNQILMTQTHTPGSQFGVGTTEVRYLFQDAAGNSALCIFNVVITGKKKKKRQICKLFLIYYTILSSSRQ